MKKKSRGIPQKISAGQSPISLLTEQVLARIAEDYEMEIDLEAIAGGVVVRSVRLTPRSKEAVTGA